jgi:carboxyl-terminal processing protease
MSHKSRSAHQFRGLPPLIIAALALTLYIGLFPRSTNLRAKLGFTQEGLASKTGAIDSAADEAAASILLDSIVSLVQTYYVDSGRVRGEKLIAGTMRSLAYAIPELRFDQMDGKYSLTAKNETISFNEDNEMPYEEVLGRLKSLISFCDRIKVTAFMDGGENIMLGAEKDSATIVLNALLSSLDAHSSLLSAEAYQDLRQGTEGSFGGLGVLVGVRDSILTVLKPLPRSPAQRVGVRKDDKIIAIDGFNTFGLSLDRLVTHMRGAPGTTAELLTLRPGDWSPKAINLEREMIAVDSVEAFEHHHKNQHILRLAVENFASRTSKEIREHIRKFRQKFAINGLVLDLRGNPGGLLDQAVHVSDIFLEGGIVVTTKGRKEEVERAVPSNDERDYPVVVLMNEDSASASEIVAGALQDNGRAVVIGQPSFGKGSVQTVFELPEQRALKLTIARYFTPANKSIQNIGIIPDIWIQPVVRSSENANLFGSYRYRNEQFLPNHLVTPSEASQMTASLKGYYLVGDPAAELSAQKSDPSMEIALSMFSKVSESYGARLPEGARRASHWIALALPALKNQLFGMSREAISWLQTKHNIRWRPDSERSIRSHDIALDIKAPLQGIVAVPGVSFDLPWKVVNNSKNGVENVSVFIQSPVSGLETKEFLVGYIGAGQVCEGVLKISTPSTLSSGRHYVNAGIAIDEQALSNVQDEFLINVVDRETSELSADIVFVDGVNSLHQNVLEPNERAKFKVEISNKGRQDVRDVKMAVSNLSGKQVQTPIPEVTLSKISPGEKISVYVPLEADGRLESSFIDMGFVIRHADSNEAVFKVSGVKTSVPRLSTSSGTRLSH